MMKPLDRLLRQTLRERTVANRPGPCLDAETLAGWFDGTLAARDRAAAEAHAADCARCQALLAAMARTAPPVEAHPWWRASFMGWLVPLTVAATALLVWVNLPGRSIAPAAPAPAVKPADEIQARAEATPPVSPAVPPTAAAARNQRPAMNKAEQREAPRERAAPSRDAVAPDDGRFARAVPDLQPPPASEPAAAAPAPSAEARAETITIVSGSQAASARMRSALRDTLVVSSHPSTRWRIVTGGTVERSTDGGITWETQVTGATVTLTAGVSPSPFVCWLVGPGGIVLVTTDGRSWQRLAFPEAVDLVAIRATDDRTATVTTIDGRRFSTADGGQTWDR
jgi:hypothetical protein